MVEVLRSIGVIILCILICLIISIVILYNLFWIFLVSLWRSFKEITGKEPLGFRETKNEIKQKIKEIKNND